jgi:hypothetical protein
LSHQLEVFVLKRIPFFFVSSSPTSTSVIFQSCLAVTFAITFLTFADSFYAASIPRLELATEEGAREAQTSRSYESSAD